MGGYELLKYLQVVAADLKSKKLKMGEEGTSTERCDCS